jgi:hypothetical protein
VTRVPSLRDRLARHWLLGVYLGSVVLVAFQFGGRAGANNLKIFHWSFFHLLRQQDVYAQYPELYYDIFKYSPSWALLFAPFALPPIAVGFFLWDVAAALLLYGAVRRVLPAPQARLALAIAFLEFVAAMQHASSTNSVVAALIILAFVALEQRREAAAAGAIALGALMKIYPLAALSFGLFHARKRRFALAFAIALLALIALPLLVTPPGALLAQWRSWGHVLAVDSGDRGFSVMQLLHQWAGVTWPNWPVQLAGTALLLLPLALGRDRWADPHFRRLFLCSLLLYCLIFNHQSERPSFVVGFAGIAIWYAMSRPAAWRTALMGLAFLGVPVLHSAAVPWSIREHVLLPHYVISIPCVIAWVAMQVELLRHLPVVGEGGRSSATRGTTAAAPADVSAAFTAGSSRSSVARSVRS